jgi:hypothetical protein
MAVYQLESLGYKTGWLLTNHTIALMPFGSMERNILAIE